MSLEIIQERLLSYEPKTISQQENALKEIAQEIALLALSRAGFFRVASFQGGTCLRILYGLERFSEDLDFALDKPDKQFNWQQYVAAMSEEFDAYGFRLEVKNKDNVDNAVKIAFLKADSKGGLLILNDPRTNRPQLRIKLEIDINPPQGANYELKYLDFPLSFSVKAHDLPSLFAGKCHALLCREYVKGRDWYDFYWYVARSTPINFKLLNHALIQAGPWQGKDIVVTPKWLLQQLKNKINTLDWDKAKKDVERFLRPQELKGLDVWTKEFFLSRVEKLATYL